MAPDVEVSVIFEAYLIVALIFAGNGSKRKLVPLKGLLHKGYELGEFLYIFWLEERGLEADLERDLDTMALEVVLPLLVGCMDILA